MNRHSVPNALFAYSGKPENGGSNPRFYEFDDGTVRLVKWHPSSQGPKLCYNELVASRLAQLLDAPMLRGDVVFVSEEIIPDDQRAFAQAGFNYGVVKMRGENFVPEQHYKGLTNVTDLPMAVVLLQWLQIGDQKNHNQYLERVVSEDEWNLKEIGKRFRVVDAGFMYGSAKWTRSNLPDCTASHMSPKHLTDRVSDGDLSDALNVLVGLTAEDIRDCFESVPDEWGIDPSDRQAAADHAIHSRDKLTQAGVDALRPL